MTNKIRRFAGSLIMAGQIAAAALGVYGIKEIHESTKVEAAKEVLSLERKKEFLPRTSKKYLDIELRQNEILRNPVVGAAYQELESGSRFAMGGGLALAVLSILSNSNRKNKNPETKEYLKREKIEAKARKEIARQYNFGGAHEDANYGRALIASKAYREIASELRNAGFPVLGVYQTREFNGTSPSDLSSMPLGAIHVMPNDISTVSDYFAQFTPHINQNEHMPQTNSRREFFDSKAKEAFYVTSATPPKRGLAHFIERTLEDPTRLEKIPAQIS